MANCPPPTLYSTTQSITKYGKLPSTHLIQYYPIHYQIRQTALHPPYTVLPNPLPNMANCPPPTLYSTTQSITKYGKLPSTHLIQYYPIHYQIWQTALHPPYTVLPNPLPNMANCPPPTLYSTTQSITKYGKLPSTHLIQYYPIHYQIRQTALHPPYTVLPNRLPNTANCPPPTLYSTTQSITKYGKLPSTHLIQYYPIHYQIWQTALHPPYTVLPNPLPNMANCPPPTLYSTTQSITKYGKLPSTHLIQHYPIHYQIWQTALHPPYTALPNPLPHLRNKTFPSFIITTLTDCPAKFSHPTVALSPLSLHVKLLYRLPTCLWGRWDKDNKLSKC